MDNGGEFHNDELRDFCENLNKKTAAESPWSNTLIERHNGIIGKSVSKVMSDVNCSLELALSWAVTPKNSPQDVCGFSPNQLVFRRNPYFPNTLTDKPPALEGKTHSEMVASNLNAMHSAREAFIEKIRRALQHQIRASVNVKYIMGDSVSYKRSMSNKLKGPATVTSQDSQQVFVKHGNVCTRESIHVGYFSVRIKKDTKTKILLRGREKKKMCHHSQTHCQVFQTVKIVLKKSNSVMKQKINITNKSKKKKMKKMNQMRNL